MCTHNLCFEQKYDNCQKFHLKIIIFKAVKNCNILYRCVFVTRELLWLQAMEFPLRYQGKSQVIYYV